MSNEKQNSQFVLAYDAIKIFQWQQWCLWWWDTDYVSGDSDNDDDSDADGDNDGMQHLGLFL